MGRKLDALLGRRSKLKTTLNLAVSRLSILKKHRHARFTVARTDVIQLLRLNHHQQALLRVEQVIKDQDLLDVYDMIHDYCHLIIQRINLLEQANDFPGELKEAASSILYAAPRCGEFPELQEVRAILTARFGKEFVNNAIELRRKCGVDQKMIEKLSPKQLSLECRMMMLTGLAKENGVILQPEISSPVMKKEEVAAMVLPNKIEKVLSLSKSMKERRIYKDAADAAHDAFESATYAAAAARAAVELSRSESFASAGPDSPRSQTRINAVTFESVKSKLSQMGREKRYSSSRYDSESEYEEIITEEREGERSKYNMNVDEFGDLYSDDYSDDENIKSFKKKMDCDYETEKEETRFPSRNAYFSSYKQFPRNPKAGLGR